MTRNTNKNDLDVFKENLKNHLEELKNKGEKEEAEKRKKYLKSPYKFYGVSTKHIRNSTKKYFKKHRSISKDYLKFLLNELWDSQWHTEKTFSISLAEEYLDLFDSKDIDIFEVWLKEAKGWDHTDSICINIIGHLLLKDSKLQDHINKWADHKSIWVRRACLVSYITALREGKDYLSSVFSNIKKLSDDKNIFIEKAVGWVLREGSKKFEKRIEDFVLENKNRLANLSIREALRIFKDKNFIENVIGSKD